MNDSYSHDQLSRRSMLQIAAAGVAGAVLTGGLPAASAASFHQNSPTKFQIACMTLPYSQFPLKRALTGIKSAGYDFVAWGTSHRETVGGQRVPVMPADAPPAKAKELAQRCRDLGLEPLMMFSTIYPEASKGLEVLTHRLRQASAAGVPQVLTFGHTKGGNRKLWIERFKQLGPIARDHGSLLVVKRSEERRVG